MGTERTHTHHGGSARLAYKGIRWRALSDLYFNLHGLVG
ncbi:hypothetical protein MMASJCM_2880 [Mycobacteroides abscessus subsp. massiliense CCUG 48898 = JCM 15300]|nr:hypothetical protein MMASJCM_2880 [Mycobacteroides abscessus subsp. massiliense CCUG 48898 = JCM 15300]